MAKETMVLFVIVTAGQVRYGSKGILLGGGRVHYKFCLFFVVLSSVKCIFIKNNFLVNLNIT